MDLRVEEVCSMNLVMLAKVFKDNHQSDLNLKILDNLSKEVWH